MQAMSEEVERFFNGSQCKSPSTDPRPGITLLSGPPCCGKTSLLFQFAYNLAVSKGESQPPIVVFICRRRRLEAKPPYLSQGIDSSSDVFGRIHMKYVDDDEGLRKYFAAFHLLETVPTSVIVDDFEELFDESETAPCELLLADTQHGDSPRLLYIYKRWVSSILTIRGDGCGSFLLRSEVRTYSGRRIAAKYSIALQYLLLDRITEDAEE